MKSSVKELRKLSTTELNKELKNLQDSMLKLRFQKVVDEVNDTTQTKKARRKIAQIKTLMREQELAPKSEPEKKS